MGKPALISIIMPVYNPGKYLHTAIKGILDQSYENFELICIDDASTDGSEQVLTEYQKHDKHIRLFHHSENMGAACTRNEGIGLARGKYLFFLDADDVFEKDLLKYMVQAAERESADMAYVPYDMFEDGKPYSDDIRGDYFYFSKCFAQYNEKEKCPKGLLRSIPHGICSRLYSSEFMKRTELRFQDLKSSNDVYFGIMATSLAHRIAFLDEQANLVHVRVHGSQYRISNQRNTYDNFRAYAYLLQEMKKLQLPDADMEIVRERFLANVLWELKECSPEQRGEFYRFINTKGLDEMGILEEIAFANLDPVYQGIAEAFRKKPLESKWLENFSMTGYRIEKQKERVVRLFEQIAIQGKTCGIWGAGKDGRLLASICAENHCPCKGFIDKDERKWGETLFGYKIFSPDELLETVDTVIVLNQGYFNDIYDQVKTIRNGIELVSLNMYLQYEQDLSSSTIRVSD